jgi:hypothetical protein
MPDTRYTPRQRAALSWAALVRANAPWRDILAHRLSFTEPGWDPLTQLYGSIPAGFGALHIHPGEACGLGFAAFTNADGTVNEQDAAELLEGWLPLLATPGHQVHPAP